jgi:hypothetical protein
MPRPLTQRARRAALLCVLWIVGIELMPGLHEQLHGMLAPHRHDAGSIVTVSFEETTHRHPDGTIHYVAPHSKRIPRDGNTRAGVPPHASDGLAHHMAALSPAAPPRLAPLPIDRRPTWVAIAIAADLFSIDPLAATARGPPVA